MLETTLQVAALLQDAEAGSSVSVAQKVVLIAALAAATVGTAFGLARWAEEFARQRGADGRQWFRMVLGAGVACALVLTVVPAVQSGQDALTFVQWVVLIEVLVVAGVGIAFGTAATAREVARRREQDGSRWHRMGFLVGAALAVGLAVVLALVSSEIAGWIGLVLVLVPTVALAGWGLVAATRAISSPGVAPGDGGVPSVRVSPPAPVPAPETPAAHPRPQIRVEGAVKSFSGRVVVDVDDLVFGDVPIEGLIGPNGAGKTTLMRMIMHSTPLDRGQITLLPEGPGGDEIVLSRLPTHAMARHGVVKSNQVIMDFEKLTIWDSLLLAAAEARYENPARAFAEPAVFEPYRAEIQGMIDHFGFEDPSGYAMSAGEKKLLDILRCLLLEPRFLRLDEPTAGLPDELTDKVMEAIRQVAAAGTAVVIVEHDLNVIWNLCDEVHFMAVGEVQLRGTPEEIRRHSTVVEQYLGEGHV
jgi:ABC-type branched-subunit amino acid transport system ATPase component